MSELKYTATQMNNVMSSSREYYTNWKEAEATNKMLTARIAELEASLAVHKEIVVKYEEQRSEIIKLSNETVERLNSRIAELEAESERFTVHSDIERKVDKSPNDTQTQKFVYGKESEE